MNRDSAWQIVTDLRIGLRVAEYRTLQSEMDAARPAPQPVLSLEEQRKALVAEVHEAAVAERDLMAQAVRTSYMPLGKQAELKAKTEAARAALTAFDAEHPEVLAAIKAETEESVKRHMWD